MHEAPELWRARWDVLDVDRYHAHLRAVIANGASQAFRFESIDVIDDTPHICERHRFTSSPSESV
jgi:hypothetical protein